MNKFIQSLKNNKRIIAIVLLVGALIAAVWFLNSTEEESSSAEVSKSATEIRLCALLSSIEGVGDTDVMIYENEGEISGVVIVCSGGDSIMVRNDILNAVSTALNIEKNIIAIYAMTN